MKVAISIPDAIFEQAEAYARRLGRTRSAVYSRALAEYLAQHVEDRVTAAMNQALDEVGEEADGFSREAARRTLERTEW